MKSITFKSTYRDRTGILEQTMQLPVAWTAVMPISDWSKRTLCWKWRTWAGLGRSTQGLLFRWWTGCCKRCAQLKMVVKTWFGYRSTRIFIHFHRAIFSTSPSCFDRLLPPFSILRLPTSFSIFNGPPSRICKSNYRWFI